jgi:hypothetical protein
VALKGRLTMWRRLPLWKRGLVYLGCLVVGLVVLGVVIEVDPPLGSTAAGVFVIVVFLAVLVGFYLWSVRLRRPSIKPIASLRKVAGGEVPFLPDRREFARTGLLSWLWPGRAVFYDLALPPHVVIESIQSRIRPERMLDSLLAPEQLRGWVDGSRLRLVVAAPFGHGFEGILDGEIIPAGNGTRLAAVLRLRPATRAFIVVWFVLAIGLCVPAAIATVVDPAGWHPSPPPLFVPLLFPMFGVFFLVMARVNARAQGRVIVRDLDAIFGLTSSQFRTR